MHYFSFHIDDEFSLCTVCSDFVGCIMELFHRVVEQSYIICKRYVGFAPDIAPDITPDSFRILQAYSFLYHVFLSLCRIQPRQPGLLFSLYLELEILSRKFPTLKIIKLKRKQPLGTKVDADSRSLESRL